MPKGTKYEPCRLSYTVHKCYVPDFELPNKIYVEAKGLFTANDRTKMAKVKVAHPDLDIRLLFQRDNYLYKGSDTRYSDWCRALGFKFAIGTKVPKAWIKEKKQQ
jgi:hypothetical protein